MGKVIVSRDVIIDENAYRNWNEKKLKSSHLIDEENKETKEVDDERDPPTFCWIYK